MKLKLCHYYFYIFAFLFSPLPLYAETFISRTYEFAPNKPVVLENPLFWGVNLICSMDIKDSETFITGLMKKNGGEINGQTLKEGQSVTVLLRHKDILTITAERRAKVEITNQGVSTVVANCTL